LRLRSHRHVRALTATVSHHLRILRDAGLVEAERRGTWAYYRLVPDAIERLREVFSVPALVPA
jgi:ArsR family transcriptional regulator